MPWTLGSFSRKSKYKREPGIIMRIFNIEFSSQLHVCRSYRLDNGRWASVNWVLINIKNKKKRWSRCRVYEITRYRDVPTFSYDNEQMKGVITFSVMRGCNIGLSDGQPIPQNSIDYVCNRNLFLCNKRKIVTKSGERVQGWIVCGAKGNPPFFYAFFLGMRASVTILLAEVEENERLSNGKTPALSEM